MEQTWCLAHAWYHDRLSPEFRGRTIPQAEAIFQRLGLTSAFWRLADVAGPVSPEAGEE